MSHCSAKGLNWKKNHLSEIYGFDRMVMANIESSSKYSNLVEVITFLAKNWLKNTFWALYSCYCQNLSKNLSKKYIKKYVIKICQKSFKKCFKKSFKKTSVKKSVQKIYQKICQKSFIKSVQKSFKKSFKNIFQK